MPELSIHYTRICMSNVHWEMPTLSEDFSKTYVVKFTRLDPIEESRQGCQYGWTCQCQAFKYRKKPGKLCKHIENAKPHHCGWNAELEVTALAGDKNGKPCCPDCRGETDVVKVGV